jgi:hypothetical protein
MANSIGRVGYDSYCTKQGWRAFNGEPLKLWEDNPREDIKAAWDAAGEATILYALDLMAAAGVTPVEAAAQIRAGRTIEEVCASGDQDMYPGCVNTCAGHGVTNCATCCKKCGGSGLLLEHPSELPFSQSLAAMIDCDACQKPSEPERRQELKQAFLDSAPDSGRDAAEPTVDDELRAHARGEDLSFSQRAARRGARSRAERP